MTTQIEITHGAGRTVAIDADVAANYGGTTEEALRGIVRDHITDPALAATLASGDFALEVSLDDAESGATREAPLAPNSDWAGQLSWLLDQETNPEIGIARRHEGGSEATAA